MAVWFRSWHGAPTDNKWLVIAKRADTSPGIVSAVYWALLDHASQAADRGSVNTFDVETYSAFSGFDEETIESILSAMTDKGIIVDNRLTAWDKRQPQREDNSTQRVKTFRERKAEDATQCNAVKRNVTQGNNTEVEVEVEVDTEVEDRTETEKPKPGAKRPTPTIPPAAQVFLENGGQFSTGKLADGTTKKAKAIAFIAEKVGEDPKALDRWAKVVAAYCLQWSGKSYTVMLNDYFLQNRIPGEQNKNGNSQRRSTYSDTPERRRSYAEQ